VKARHVYFIGLSLLTAAVGISDGGLTAMLVVSGVGLMAYGTVNAMFTSL
jgi:hypothetical protein